MPLTFDEIAVGQKYIAAEHIDAAAMDAFRALSGDSNPLHMDRTAARQQGATKSPKDPSVSGDPGQPVDPARPPRTTIVLSNNNPVHFAALIFLAWATSLTPACFRRQSVS